METGENPQVSAAPSARKRSRVLLVFAALFLGLVLLSAWFTPKAFAQDAPQATLAVDAPAFDLAISKSKSSTYFTVGSGNLYYINVYRTNTAPVTDTVVVEDLIPTGMTIDGIEATDWNCSLSTNVVLNCRFTRNESLTSTVTVLPTIFFTVNVASDIAPVVTNTANLLTTDNNLLNNSANAITEINSVDLEVVKFQEPYSGLPGDTITYTLVITNNGPHIATDVIVEDTISEFLTYGTPVPTIGSFNTTTGIWNVGSLLVDGTAKLIFTASINADADGEIIENIAKISSSNTSDWNTANNTDKTTLIVGGLKIEKSANRTSAAVGAPIIYDIKVTNVSVNTISGILFSDVFTTGLDVDLDASNDLTNDVTLYRNSIDQTIINSNFSLPGLSSINIHIVARANSTVTIPKILTNSAKVEWSINPRLSATSNEVQIEVYPSAALLITKDDGKTTVTPGQVLTYTITLKNIGSLAMPPGVIISDTLPLNVTLDNFIKDTLPVDPEFLANNTIIKAKLTSALGVGQEISFRIVVNVNTGLISDTKIINTVRISAPADTNGNTDVDDDDIDTVASTSTSGMDIALTVNPKQGKVGDSFTFKIVVTNTGNISASNVKVTGNLQSILDYVSSTPASGTVFTPIASGTSRSYTWTIGSLLPGQQRILSMVWKVNSYATASSSHEHYATLNWDTSKNLNSNTVKYRIVGGSTLPATGWSPQEKDPSGLANLALIVGAVLGVLGLSALGYGLWARHRKPLWATWFVITGLILLGGGGLFGAAAWGFRTIPPNSQHELAAIDRSTPAPPPENAPLALATDFVEDLGAWPTPTPQTLPDYPIPTPPASLNEGPNGNEPELQRGDPHRHPRYGVGYDRKIRAIRKLHLVDRRAQARNCLDGGYILAGAGRQHRVSRACRPGKRGQRSVLEPGGSETRRPDNPAHRKEQIYLRHA